MEQWWLNKPQGSVALIPDHPLVRPAGLYNSVPGYDPLVFLYGHNMPTTWDVSGRATNVALASSGVAPVTGKYGGQIYTSGNDTGMQWTRTGVSGGTGNVTLAVLMKFPVPNSALGIMISLTAGGMIVVSNEFALSRAAVGNFSFGESLASYASGWHWVIMPFTSNDGTNKQGRLYIDGIERGTRVTNGPIDWYEGAAGTVEFWNNTTISRTRGCGHCAAAFLWDHMFLGDAEIRAFVEDPWGMFYDPSRVSVLVKAPAGGGATGTAAITNDDDTVSASGGITATSSAAITNADDTVTASGSVYHVGTAAITEAGDTVSASGTISYAGSAAITETGDTAAGTGTISTPGSAAITNGDDTVNASGYVASGAEGSAAISEAGDTVAAVGFNMDIIGTAAITESVDTVYGTGTAGLVAGLFVWMIRRRRR